MKTDKKGRDMQMFPLGLLSAGEKAEVMEIRQGATQGTCMPGHVKADRIEHICRCEDMGLRTGKTVEMLNNQGGGALLVKIDETRIALGRGMAMKVMVRRNSE